MRYKRKGKLWVHLSVLLLQENKMNGIYRVVGLTELSETKLCTPHVLAEENALL
jgi:hypothetical protein